MEIRTYTDKDKIKMWIKGRLFESMNGLEKKNTTQVLEELLEFIDCLQGKE